MLPIIELRGAIPVGAGLGLPWLESFLVSIAGNMLPIPFILLFIKKILQFMQNQPKLEKIANWVLDKAEKRTDKVTRYESLGLMIFVAIPLPGTGAWTGALIAALLGMRFRYAMISIFAGVLIAGAIVTGISYGVLGFLEFLL